jgi:hypothetical protein
MSKVEDKTKSEETVAEEKATSSKLYNFTRHNFSVEASSQEEAEVALEKHLKQEEKETK